MTKGEGEARAVEFADHPLVPARMLEAVRRMAERLRTMEPRASERSRGRVSLRGSEVVRAASLLSAGVGDLWSDLTQGLAAEQVEEAWRAAKAEGEAPRPIALETDERTRMRCAMGAAAALRAQGQGRLVILYARAESLPTAGWREVLGLAGEAALPVIVCVLPGAGGRGAGELRVRSQGYGVPGIPVDAADAVALLRVMQECVQRVRAGDGPALLEAVAWTGPKTRPGRAVRRG